jgi:protein-disulfide isomerase
MQNEAQSPVRDTLPSSPARVDPLAIATLAGVVVMLTLSLWNLWNLKRLGERVAVIEARIGGARATGPDSKRVHQVRTAGAPASGPAGAPVTIVEFSDFQCPFCARAVPTLRQLQERYGANVRIVWKHLPLPIHRDAVGAALAAEAAAKQGRFWEFHDRLFADQKRLASDDLRRYAHELELDVARFDADRSSADQQKTIDADMAEAVALGISGTPAFFVNGRFVDGAQPFDVFAAIIDDELAKTNVAAPPKSSSN